METIKSTIKQAIVGLGYKSDDVEVMLSPVDNSSDYATSLALRYAKHLDKSPLDLAAEIRQQLIDTHALKGVVKKIEVAKPGFINFYLDPSYLHEQLQGMIATGDKYGTLEIGKDKTIIVEYSSPNIAKQMHVGHLRSTIIGQSLARLYDALGYTVVRDNHLGDWGTGFGKLIAAYREAYGDTLNKELTIAEMEQLYVDFSTRAKENETLQEQARQELKELQDGEAFHVSLWELFRQKSLDELDETIYTLLNVRFDTQYGEAFFYKLPAVKKIYGEEAGVYVDDIVEDLLHKGIALKSEGAVIIPSENDDQPPTLIRKSDGAYLYATSDLATVKMRQQRFHPDKVLYVVAYQQDLHFKQVIGVAEKLDYAKAGELEHISFGLVLGAKGKKMSTREGNVVSAADIIQRSIQEALAIVTEKNPDMEEAETKRIAAVIGIGALKYNDLSRDRMTDITFDWEAMMNMSAGSSPYLQYTYARIQSIITKAGGVPHKADLAQLTHELEHGLLKQLVRFSDVLQEAATVNKPNVLALYLEQLAAHFHKLYEHLSILQAENSDVQKARLQLIQAVAMTMKQGLYILGIEVLDRI